jgi:hypothetical protein
VTWTLVDAERLAALRGALVWLSGTYDGGELEAVIDGDTFLEGAPQTWAEFVFMRDLMSLHGPMCNSAVCEPYGFDYYERRAVAVAKAFGACECWRAWPTLTPSKEKHP